MFIEFRNTNKKQQRTIEDALWFAKSYLLPRHKIDEIEIESVKGLLADGDCYDAEDRSFIIRVNKELSKEDQIACSKKYVDCSTLGGYDPKDQCK